MLPPIMDLHRPLGRHWDIIWAAEMWPERSRKKKYSRLMR